MVSLSISINIFQSLTLTPNYILNAINSFGLLNAMELGVWCRKLVSLQFSAAVSFYISYVSVIM